MNNISKIIQDYNKKDTCEPRDQVLECDCRVRAEYSMKGNCQNMM